jgi:predicted DNA-binding transcriptional regulator YafY
VARRAPEWTQEPPSRHPLAVDPAELAAFLLAPPLLGTPPRQPQAIDLLPKIERRLHVVRQQTLEVIDAKAPQLDPEQRRMLADAIDDQRAVRIDYVDGDGRFSSRVIEEIELSGAVIEAWCQLREDERMFLLDRIDAVSPA